MTLSPPLRKLLRTAHIIITVGWLGSVAAFLVLAVAGLTSREEQMVRAAYLAMDLITRFVIVPLSLAPLLTGPLLALGTPWGLFRHYWIIAKLVITLVSAIIMQAHLQPIRVLALAATTSAVFGQDLQRMQVQMVVASAAALVALVTLSALAVYKPRGMTRYGWEKQYRERGGTSVGEAEA